jgi:hypothetical protein
MQGRCAGIRVIQELYFHPYCNTNNVDCYWYLYATVIGNWKLETGMRIVLYTVHCTVHITQYCTMYSSSLQYYESHVHIQYW